MGEKIKMRILPLIPLVMITLRKIFENHINQYHNPLKHIKEPLFIQVRTKSLIIISRKKNPPKKHNPGEPNVQKDVCPIEILETITVFLRIPKKNSNQKRDLNERLNPIIPPLPPEDHPSQKVKRTNRKSRYLEGIP